MIKTPKIMGSSPNALGSSLGYLDILSGQASSNFKVRVQLVAVSNNLYACINTGSVRYSMYQRLRGRGVN